MDSYDQDDLKVLLLANLENNFQLLVFAYQHKLYTFVWHMLNCPQEAEDIVQEVFLKMYQTLLRLSPLELQELKLTGYLFTIARNLSINHVSRGGRRQTQEVSLDLAEEERKSVEDMLSTQCNSPEEEFERKESCEELYACIRCLSDSLRAPVVLHYILGFSYSEIATILNQPLSTVKCNGGRGFKKLQEMLKGE